MNYELTEEEKNIEDNINNLKPVSEEKRQRVKKIIDKAKRSRMISLRVNEDDLKQIKKKAEKKGIPYQRLINMVLHEYATDALLDKEEVKKIFNTLKEKELTP